MSYDETTIEAEQTPEENKKVKWTKFVEGDLVNFFHAHKLEKLQVEDDSGNKAKLSKTKDDDLRIEQSSITIR